MKQSASSSQWEEGEGAYLATLKLISHHGIALAVKAAVELDIFNILARAGPNAHLSALEIACQILNCDPAITAHRLERVLRFLTSHSILRCSVVPSADHVEHRYAIEPIYRLLAKNQYAISLSAALLVTQSKASLHSWINLKDVVLEAVNPFAKANGMQLFDYMAKNQKYGELFNEFMESMTKLTSKKIIDAYKGFESVSILVDAGGGVGAMLEMIISNYPHINGVNFDLPHVISISPAIPGVMHVAGDMFVSIPCGDAILLKNILHSWSDEDCIRILKNCYNSLPITGKIILVEHILPNIPKINDEAQHVYYMDIGMMVTFPHGKERHETEFRALANEAGFTEFKISCCVMNYHVMEFIK